MSTPDIKIMFNEDPNHHFGECMWAKKHYRPDFEFSDETEKEFIYQYKGTQLTDFLINVNFMCSTFPSKVKESYCQHWLGKLDENGKPIDYKNDNGYYNTFIRDGFDIYACWIKYLREIGVRPWLSFRMNDIHGVAESDKEMMTHFYYDHPEHLRVRHHVPDGYFSKPMDYGLKVVRDEMMAYMKESLERYDVDGIELDFMREPFCFQIGRDYKDMGIMTQYIRDIRAMLNGFEAKRSHKIMLSVKLFAIPDQVYLAGFDYFTYAKEHLIDILVVGPRWETIDNDIPIEVWKNIMEPYGVKVAAGLELILRCQPHGEFFYLNTHETTLGSAAQYLSAGGDFTYLYNYMHPLLDYDKQVEFHYPIYGTESYQKLMCNAGDIVTACNSPRRHIVTFHDIEPQWYANKLSSLPLTVENNNCFPQVHARCGKLPANSDVYVVLGAQPEDNGDCLEENDFRIFINSVEIKLSGKCDIKPFSKFQGYYFRVNDISVIDNCNVIEVACGGRTFTCEYVEIRVNAPLDTDYWGNKIN